VESHGGEVVGSSGDGEVWRSCRCSGAWDSGEDDRGARGWRSFGLGVALDAGEVAPGTAATGMAWERRGSR
jgi:hypothetical protein